MVIIRDDVLLIKLLVVEPLIVGLLVSVHGALEVESVQVVSSVTVPEGVAVPIVA